jgi:hypothetical protein
MTTTPSCRAWLLWAAIGLSAGCAGLDGYRDTDGRWRYRDEGQALRDQVNIYNDNFTDKKHPGISP